MVGTGSAIKYVKFEKNPEREARSFFSKISHLIAIQQGVYRVRETWKVRECQGIGKWSGKVMENQGICENGPGKCLSEVIKKYFIIYFGLLYLTISKFFARVFGARP